MQTIEVPSMPFESTAMTDPQTLRCPECPVLECSIFSCCPPELLGVVAAARELRIVRRDEELFVEGDRVAGVYCVRDGRFAMLRSSRGRDEHVLAVTHAGNGLGARDLLQSGTHTQTAVALEETHVCFVPAGIVRSLALEFPTIIVRVMQGVCRRLSELERRMERHELLMGRL